MAVEDKALKEAFQRVRKALGYPPLHLPAFVDNDETACIYFDKDYHEIEISNSFLEELVKKGLSRDSALEAILKHEVNHYSKHPYDCKTILKEVLWLDKYGNKKDIIRLHYDDVIDNLDLIVNKGDTTIHQMYQKMSHGSAMMQVMRAYYNEVTGQDFGVEKKVLPQSLQEKVMQLKRIDFLNMDHMKANLLRFAAIVHDIKDIGTPPLATYELKKMGLHDIEHALKQAAKDPEISQEDFKKLLNIVEKELKEDSKKSVSPGRKDILLKLQKADSFYYEALAQKYTLSVRKLPFQQGGGLFPAELKQFELDDDVSSYDAINSYGRLSPNPKKWEYNDFTSFGSREKTPNALLLLDSSGSMPNPSQTLSYAVLACFCAANAYLLNGSKVGVINFSDRNIFVPFTDDAIKIYDSLVTYQQGGTSLHIDDLEKIVKSTRDKIDIILVSDASIHNFEDVVKYINKIKNKNRVTFIRMKDGDSFGGEKNFALMQKLYGKSISFYEVENHEDLLKIVLGNVEW